MFSVEEGECPECSKILVETQKKFDAAENSPAKFRVLQEMLNKSFERFITALEMFGGGATPENLLNNLETLSHAGHAIQLISKQTFCQAADFEEGLGGLLMHMERGLQKTAQWQKEFEKANGHPPPVEEYQAELTKNLGPPKEFFDYKKGAPPPKNPLLDLFDHG